MLYGFIHAIDTAISVCLVSSSQIWSPCEHCYHVVLSLCRGRGVYHGFIYAEGHGNFNVLGGLQSDVVPLRTQIC